MALIEISEKHFINTDYIEAVEMIKTKSGGSLNIIVSGKRYEVSGTPEHKIMVIERIKEETSTSKVIRQSTQFNAG